MRQEKRRILRFFKIAFGFFIFCILMMVVFFLFNDSFGHVITKYKGRFMDLEADEARLAYETRSILGYAQTITVASVGVFLPLLVKLWNDSRQTVEDKLEKLIALKDDPNFPNKDDLDKDICTVRKAIKNIADIADELRKLFSRTIVVVFLFLIVLGYANFVTLGPVVDYVLVVVLQGVAIVLVLWLFTLFCLHLKLVQPIVHKARDLHLYNLDLNLKIEQ